MPPWPVPVWVASLLITLAPGTAGKVLPRIVFQYGDPARSVTSFSQVGIQNYNQLLLVAEKETLYVGARENILELKVQDSGNLHLVREVSWPSKEEQILSCQHKARQEAECHNFIRVLQPINDTHLYVCGTNAFNPSCTYVNLNTFSLWTIRNNETMTLDGRGQSPFDPQHKHTEIIVDGELYTGTMNNFIGNEPIIFRTLGTRTSLKTDASLGWLHSDTSFTGSFYIPGANSDGKVYFFFDETGKEFDFFDKLTVSRVARVCKDDVGGDKVLQKKWTTFLKAQLVCAHSDNFPFNVMHHVALLNPADPQGAVFYGVFSSQWHSGGSGSSAVCSFRLADIEAAFDGSYKEQNKESSKWTRFTGHVSTPRPGSCSAGKFSDTDLNFMKDHFLMDDKVLPAGRAPLLIQQSVGYTRIALDSVPALSGGDYTVMFLGTDAGALHKVVLVRNGTQSHVIEGMNLLRKPEPIETLLMVPDKRILYVGTSAGILQVPVANCSVYRTCFECILARDPYCAWNKNGNQCQSLPANPSAADWLQDVETGNPDTTCLSPPPKGRAPRPAQDLENPPLRAENHTVPYNTILKLECPQMSSLATYSWESSSRAPRQLVTATASLIVIVRSDTLGLYECWADERGFRYKVAQYWVKDPSGMSDDSGGGISFSADEPDYYKPFVAVTVLLALTLSAAVCAVLYSGLDKIKANRKIQGCSTPETEKLSAQADRAPLNGFYRTARSLAKPCCVPITGATDAKMDLDNNMMPNGGAAPEASSDV